MVSIQDKGLFLVIPGGGEKGEERGVKGFWIFKWAYGCLFYYQYVS